LSLNYTLPTLLVIPSGIGCSVGGFAGDAIPSARLLAKASGCLITHPNVMNGASLYWSDENIQYVEGYALDHFVTGEYILKPVIAQKIGLLLDGGLSPEFRKYNLAVADGCRATLGLNVSSVAFTDSPLQISIQKGCSGASWGHLANPDDLLKAAKKLKDEGATAIAVVTRFPDEYECLDDYLQGDGVDLLAGAEAVISHLIVKQLNLPAAHSPAIKTFQTSFEIDPRAAAEEIGNTFLPSVLVGLSRAPDLIPSSRQSLIAAAQSTSLIQVDNLKLVVAPSTALGGESVLACIERGIDLIMVDNECAMNVGSYQLGLEDNSFIFNGSNIYRASNYVEAAGLILAIRYGICIKSLRRPIRSVLLN
tara:strand:- start:1257 stop:2351 length:1095 start_codon:yes stop_codon:yes gene_type:complete